MNIVNQKWARLLSIESPEKDKISELVKKTKLPRTTIQRYLNALRKNGLFDYKNASYLKFVKATILIEKMYSVGLVSFLEQELTPTTIIIFGSVRKGEYDKDSDIDLFVQSSKQKKLNLSKFEKQLGHAIELFVKKDIKELPRHLQNNIINGIKLSGYLEVI